MLDFPEGFDDLKRRYKVGDGIVARLKTTPPKNDKVLWYWLLAFYVGFPTILIGTMKLGPLIMLAALLAILLGCLVWIWYVKPHRTKCPR